MSVLWRGDRMTQARIVSGLILFGYVLLHFLNIGVALISPVWADAMQFARGLVTRSVAGGVVLYGALLVHAGLALWKLASRATLRMPAWEAAQLVLGLFIPFVLAAHIVYTRVAHVVFDVNDRVGWIAVLIWDSADGWWQTLLLLAVWIHSCIGLHFWLRLTHWWHRALPWLIGAAALIPAFALAGFMTEGRRMKALFADPERAGSMLERLNWPDPAAFDWLAMLKQTAFWSVTGVVVAAVAVHILRRLLRRRRAVRISYVDGPEIIATRGPTLLEMSRAAGVPHTAQCGGRGRCSTCRVIIEAGAEQLHPPSEAEQHTLDAVGAPPGSRLACQIRPTSSTTVLRVFLPGNRRHRSDDGHGQERSLAILFLDMRGFTARTTGQLPYDVVFLLNRFFDAIVPPIRRAGGTVDKYLGDGLLAVFETADGSSSARAALHAAEGVGAALARFNETLADEGAEPVRIGIGLHFGTVVLGEIGAAGNAPRTLIGDSVNTASRLEGQTKELGVEVLISAPLLAAAGIDPEAHELVRLTLRGVDRPLLALAMHRAVDIAYVREPAPA